MSQNIHWNPRISLTFLQISVNPINLQYSSLKFLNCSLFVMPIVIVNLNLSPWILCTSWSNLVLTSGVKRRGLSQFNTKLFAFVFCFQNHCGHILIRIYLINTKISIFAINPQYSEVKSLVNPHWISSIFSWISYQYIVKSFTFIKFVIFVIFIILSLVCVQVDLF